MDYFLFLLTKFMAFSNLYLPFYFLSSSKQNSEAQERLFWEKERKIEKNKLSLFLIIDHYNFLFTRQIKLIMKKKPNSK